MRWNRTTVVLQYAATVSTLLSLTGCAGNPNEYQVRRVGEICRGSVPVQSRVQFSGTVTYANPEYPLLFVEDDSGSVRVDPHLLDAGITRGRRVRVRGVVARDPQTVLIVNAEVLPLPGEPAPFVTQPLERLIAEGSQGRLTEVRGVVREAVPEASGYCRLRMVALGRPVEIVTALPAVIHSKDMLGHEVKVRGALSTSKEYDGSLLRTEIWPQSFNDIDPLRGPLQGESVPLWSIASLRAAQGRLPDGRIRIRGAVSTRGPDGTLWLADEAGQVRLSLAEGVLLPGTGELEVSGYALAQDGALVIEQAGPAAVPAPEATRSRSLPVLKTAAAVHALSAERAQERYPASVRGVVTYFDPGFQVLFVQDRTDAVFVRPDGLEAGDLQVGDEVLASGATQLGDYAPIINQAQVRRIGRGRPLPEALAVSVDAMLTGRYDSKWVEAGGIVESVEVSQGRPLIVVASGPHRLRLKMPPAVIGEEILVDSLVRFRGVCAALYNSRRQLTGIEVQVPAPEYLAVVERGPADPFTLPVLKIGQFRQYAPERSHNRRVHVRGTATLQAPGRLYIQDPTGGLLLLTSHAPEVRPGETIEAAGFPDSTSTAPLLRQAIIRRMGSGRAPAPEQLTPEQVGRNPRFDGMLVRVEGFVLDRLWSAQGGRVVIQSGAVHFAAYLPAGAGDISWLEKDSVVQLSGVCSLLENEELAHGAAYRRPFDILLRSPSDIVVLRAPPFWNGDKARRALLTMALVLAGVTSWLAVLRRRVRAQTALISRQLAEEATLRVRKEAAEAASQAKSQFLATMSHEMRTPMNAVQGFAHLLTSSDLPPEQTEYAELIAQSSEALLVVIDDILDFSKIEAGQMKLEMVPFDLRESIRSTVAMMQQTAGKKGLELTVELAPGLPERACGDPARLRQVLVNLLGNALKFTAQGSVKVEAQLARRTEDRLVVAIRVIDTGIGIPAEARASIFAPFVQADSSTSRRFGGTGLGLAISARLVELMGGAIGVDSEPGKGSTFLFTVVLQPAVGEIRDTEPQQQTHAVGPLSILVADDNRVNRRLMARLLERAGHTATLASNGREAVASYAEGNYDLVLMDIQMPEMDGLEATAQIRTLERATGRHVPIIALTAHAMTGDREKFLAAGLDNYLPKPIDPAALHATLAHTRKGP